MKFVYLPVIVLREITIHDPSGKHLSMILVCSDVCHFRIFHTGCFHWRGTIESVYVSVFCTARSCELFAVVSNDIAMCTELSCPAHFSKHIHLVPNVIFLGFHQYFRFVSRFHFQILCCFPRKQVAYSFSDFNIHEITVPCIQVHLEWYLSESSALQAVIWEAVDVHRKQEYPFLRHRRTRSRALQGHP
jgi:hypothetical protein